jgi:branched-chain amino acid transport system ATP-binding protein
VDFLKNVLEVRDVHLSFGGIIALNGVNLQLREGEILALVGPNGSGKTSLLNCICGFYRPQKGEIIYKGKDITRTPPHIRAEMGIGRIFQTPYIFHGTVVDNIMVGYVTKNRNLMNLLTFRSTVEARKLAEELIEFVELEIYRDSPAHGLPMGIRKRIELARVLMWDPDTLLLDEPTSGLSIDEKRDMARFILELNEVHGKNILLVEHDLSLVHDIAHRAVVMDAGVEIAEGTPEEVVNNPEVIKAYLGE